MTIEVHPLDDHEIVMHVGCLHAPGGIMGIAEVGGSFEIRIDDHLLTIGPVRFGPQWYQLAGFEFSIDGVWEMP